MIQTKMTERLGIKYPIIGGAMMSISTPEFVAAVSNAGGMGILASTIYKIYLDIMKTKGVKIVETSGHSAPVELSKRFKQADMTWIHKCVGPRYARKVEGLGADLVTVVGYENGGATGNFDIATMVLIPVVKDAVDIPVVGGGCVSDGRGIAAALCLGASCVTMGTGF
jgi:NADH:quinone reductase (non-electrogenic)